MKKNLFILTIIMIILSGCAMVNTSTSGLTNESFLEFIGNPQKYKGGVDVTIDEATSFKALVYNREPDRTKGKVYAIPTGKHLVTVTFQNNVIYKQQIFLSTQETRKVELP